MGARTRDVLGYTSTATLTLLILFCGLHLNFELLHFPLSYRGDELEWIAFVHDHLTGQPFSQLFAPFHTNLPESSVGQTIKAVTLPFWLVLINTIGLFTSDPILVTNFYWLLTYPLSSLAMALLLRAVGCNWPCSITFSILYAFLPFHQIRATNHLLESSYYVVPIYTLILLNAASKTPFFSRKPNRYSIAIGLFLVILAPTSQYYTFFFVVLLAFASVYGAYHHRSSAQIKNALIILILATASLLKGNFVTVTESQIGVEQLVRADHSISTYGDAERFGLKIVQMLLPVSGHRLEVASRMRTVYDQQNPLINENSTATLGVTLSIGFLLLLGACLWRLSVTRENQVLAAMTTAIIVFATIGGLGSLMSLISNALLPHSPLSEARAFNRISVFIAAFSCMFLAKVLSNWPQSRYSSLGICCILLPITLLDMLPRGFSFSSQQADSIEQFTSDRNFFAELEQHYSDRTASVFQLPHTTHHRTQNYQDSLIPKLHTSDIAWSFGGDEGSKQNSLSQCLSALPWPSQAYALKRFGFSGVLFDKAMSKTSLPSAMAEHVRLESDRYIYVSLGEYENDGSYQSNLCKPWDPASSWKREFTASHPSINLTGDRTTISPMTLEAGIVQYGPYITLEPANYRVSWLGDICDQSSGIAEVTTNGGNNILSSRTFRCDPSGTLASIEFTLQERTKNIEFRTKATGTGNFIVNTITIENLP